MARSNGHLDGPVSFTMCFRSMPVPPGWAEALLWFIGQVSLVAQARAGLCPMSIRANRFLTRAQLATDVGWAVDVEALPSLVALEAAPGLATWRRSKRP